MILSIRKAGNDIELIWQAGTLLQSGTVNGNYVAVPGAVAPYFRITPGPSLAVLQNPTVTRLRIPRSIRGLAPGTGAGSRIPSCSPAEARSFLRLPALRAGVEIHDVASPVVELTYG